MKKLASLIILLTMLLSLCSCGEYVSSYSALGLVKNQTSHSCEASFLSFNGKLVFKLKKSDQGEEGDISYSVEVEAGAVDLYYDIYGTKQSLAHVEAGENISARGGYIEGGKTVYIFIEGTDGAKGKVSVELDN